MHSDISMNLNKKHKVVIDRDTNLFMTDFQ